MDVAARQGLLVLSAARYSQYWLALFGNTWDEPVLWNEAVTELDVRRVLRGQGLEFLATTTQNGNGAPEDPLLEVLPALMLHAMAGDCGGLPFEVRCPLCQRRPEASMQIATEVAVAAATTSPVPADPGACGA